MNTISSKEIHDSVEFYARLTREAVSNGEAACAANLARATASCAGILIRAHDDAAQWLIDLEVAEDLFAPFLPSELDSIIGEQIRNLSNEFRFTGEENA